MKRKIKILIDVLMFLLFLYLLSYRPGMGLMYHAVIGITQLSLFILHHLLNMNWFRTLFKGRYNFRRILLTASDFLLLIAMGFMIASSVMISGMVFDFGIRMTGWWRRIHVASSGWCFLLTGFHVGMHLQGVFGKLEKKMRKVHGCTGSSRLYCPRPAFIASCKAICVRASRLHAGFPC